MRINSSKSCNQISIIFSNPSILLQEIKTKTKTNETVLAYSTIHTGIYFW